MNRVTMAGRTIRVFAVLAAAALVLPALASPCAARGTGGFLRDWVVCGPLAGTKLDPPALPPEFAAYPGLFAAERVWLPVTAEENGKLDLRALYPAPEDGTALAHTFFEAPADGLYHLRVGSDDAVRVEIDGKPVHTNDTHRPWSADEDNVEVRLTKGWHRLLVRVVDYGGAWAMSVRVADDKDRPVDVRHQATVPGPLERACRLNEPVTETERAAVSEFLNVQVSDLQKELEAALPRLAAIPEGYVTFAEYEGARDLGMRFFDALALFWREAVQDAWDMPAVRDAQKAAVEAARGFSEVLAQETEKMAAAVVRSHRVWETLEGDASLDRRQFAAATLQVGELLAQSRRLAARIENERLLAARFENDIRNFRQREVTIRVLGPEGGTVDGAEVEVVQTAHDFLFGCNLFAFRRWEDDKKNALYEKRFRDLFNQATVPLYWSVVEKQRGRSDYASADAAIRWCRENRIQVKGHPLLWHETVPRWVEELPGEEVRLATGAHIREVIGRYRDTVDLWDVVQQPGPRTRIGPVTIDPVEALRWAIEARPRGKLLLNGGEVGPLADIARRMKSWGVRIDGIGAVAHQHEGPWTLDTLRKTLDTAAAADVPVYLSEVTILGSPEDEAEQAEAVRHFYTAAFAHPKVAGITWWDLSDHFAWKNAPAGLVRADLAPKPAYRTLDRLINHLWRTDAAGRTGEDGKVAVRAFFGRYRVTATQGKRKIVTELHIARDGPAEFDVILQPAK